VKRILGWVLISLLIALVLVVGGFVVYARFSTASPQPEALTAMQSTDEVEVITDGWLTFVPQETTPTTGFIFYPGGLVDPRAYAPMAQDIAAESFRVVIPRMPLNLAVFGSGKATDVIQAFPEIELWAIGGHSLGGAMASQYAHRNPASVSGLALWAAFPPEGSDLSPRDLAATLIYGTRDGLISIEEIETSRPLLPADTKFVAVEGGNHAQFGWYGPQKGDLLADLSHAEQQAQTVAATVALLDGIN
jgi:pimeloyl-ACP methyl ester carboxylesterase